MNDNGLSQGILIYVRSRSYRSNLINIEFLKYELCSIRLLLEYIFNRSIVQTKNHCKNISEWINDGNECCYTQAL